MPEYKKILNISYMLCGDRVKLVIRTKTATYDAMLTVGGKTYMDSFNDEEPFDRKTHVFYFPKDDVSCRSVLILTLKKHKLMPLYSTHSFVFGTPDFADEKELLNEYDNGLSPEKSESETVAEGVTYTHTLYKDKKGLPVHVFVTELDTAYASVYVGTPDDSYKSVHVRATIPDMAKSATENGRRIVAAVNADFFDIFGNFHPSGLCIKNSVMVANPESRRNFIAQLKSGEHIITNLDESPDIIPSVLHAASGLQMIVRDGKINDFSPLEPFSFTRHPRTAVGVKKDGGVVIAVVDGRIPDYSNGASLVDLANLMISLGCDRALNLDGGGSSAMYTMQRGELTLHSRPADLFRPTAKLIRKDYNSLLVEIK